MNGRRIDAVDAEIAHEKASGLGRAARALEEALAALAAFESAAAPADAEPDRRRGELRWNAARRLTSFIVQREACGLTDTARMIERYRVPREVLVLLGRLGAA